MRDDTDVHQKKHFFTPDHFQNIGTISIFDVSDKLVNKCVCFFKLTV